MLKILHDYLYLTTINSFYPWLVGLSGWSAGLRTKALLVRFPVRAHAWVVGHVPSRGRVRGNHTLMFSLPSPFLPFSLKINKQNLKKIKK